MRLFKQYFKSCKVKSFLIIAISCFLSTSAFGQIYTGGSFSINYEKGYYVDISPTVGYRVNAFDFGVSPFYSYSNRENRDPQYSYGTRFHTRVTVYENIFVHGELQLENIEISGEDNDRKWITSLPLGAGYSHEIAPNTRAHAMILYDVLLDDDSPSKNPIIRGGVTYSF